MTSLLLISASDHDTRVALLEDGQLAEFFLSSRQQPDPTGNIYKGRVIKVVPGIDAAFVDIGLDRPAYLPVEEVAEPWDDYVSLWLKEDSLEAPQSDSRRLLPPAPIEDLLHPGQELLVQVYRPSLGHKAARLTTYIALPGRYLVYLPTSSQLGVSRRIVQEAERQRLKTLLSELKPNDGGLIARTASQGQTFATLIQERDFLLALWEKIRQKKETCAAPALLFQEMEAALRVVRDWFDDEIDRLVVDDPQLYEQILQYLGGFKPRAVYKVELYQQPEPLLTHYGVDLAWEKLLGPRVWLKSGGYLLIETTAALTAIDVNTGRFTGRHHLEDTIFQTNLEAAREIPRQLRRRNVGGLIIIDFIDMEQPAQRDRVYQTLVEALKKDRAKTTVLPMSSLGLVEMTRQRLRDSLTLAAMEPCPHCEGTGYRLSLEIIAHDLLRQLAAEAREFPGCRLSVAIHPELLPVVEAIGQQLLKRLTEEHQIIITFTEKSQLPREHFEITRTWQMKDIKP